MQTLILSSAYEPIARIPWQRAVSLWCLDKIDVLEVYPDRFLRSQKITIMTPAVVRFKQALRRRTIRGVRYSKLAIYLRDGGRCQYCGTKLPRKYATVDHILPASRGGKTSWTNVVLACFGCNTRKGNRTPSEAHMKLKSKPERPKKLPYRFIDGIVFENGDPEQWQGYLPEPRDGCESDGGDHVVA